MVSHFIADAQLWPVGLFIAKGPQSLDMHQQMLSAWDEWLARRSPFIALRIYLDHASLETAEGVGKLTKTWLQGGAAEAIRSYVSAMLIAVPPEDHGRMKAMSVEAAFGVPGGVFADLADAFASIGPEAISPEVARGLARLIRIHQARFGD
jgi:hypothetical protein